MKETIFIGSLPKVVGPISSTEIQVKWATCASTLTKLAARLQLDYERCGHMFVARGEGFVGGSLAHMQEVFVTCLFVIMAHPGSVPNEYARVIEHVNNLIMEKRDLFFSEDKHAGIGIQRDVYWAYCTAVWVVFKEAHRVAVERGIVEKDAFYDTISDKVFQHMPKSWLQEACQTKASIIDIVCEEHTKFDDGLMH